jgi:hypothetical protein
MDLRTIRSRIDRLLEAQGPPDGPPECVVLLPENGHGPDADDDLPLPRIAWRNSKAACIVYRIEDGQPSTEDIARMVRS